MLVPISAIANKPKSIAAMIACAAPRRISGSHPAYNGGPGHERLHSRMTQFEKLPYRPCAGMMVLNREGLRLHRPARRTGPSMSTTSMPGRCRKAGSTRARTPIRRALARTLRGDQYPLGREDRRDQGLAHLRHSARARRAGVEGQISRPEAEMVSPSASPARRARSISPIPPAVSTSPNSWNGAGRTRRSFPTLSFPSSARSMSAW